MFAVEETIIERKGGEAMRCVFAVKPSLRTHTYL